MKARRFVGLLIRPGLIPLALAVTWMIWMPSLTSRSWPAGSGFVIGFCVGFVVQLVVGELQHSSFGWTLPGARTVIFRGVVVFALMAAAYVALLPRNVVGLNELQALPLPGRLSCAAFALLGFGLAPHLLALGGGRALALCATVGSFVIALMWWPAAFVAAGHWLVALAVAISAAGLLWSAHSAESWRHRARAPFRSLGSHDGSREEQRFRRERMVTAGAMAEKWPEPRLGADLRLWRQAARQELEGETRLPWWLVTLGGTLVVLGLTAAPQGLLAVVTDTGLQGQISALRRTLFEATGPKAGAFWPLTHLQPTLFLILLQQSLVKVVRSGLTLGLCYPLSRAERARVHFGCDLANTLRLGLVVVGTTLVLAWVAWVLDPAPSGSVFPAVLVPLTATLAATPSLQAMEHRLRVKGRRLSRAQAHLGAVSIVLAAATSGYLLSVTFTALLDDLHSGLKVLLLAGLLALSQLLYWRWLRRHYSRGDLV